MKQAYAPLFERLKSSIPTTTNHSESFHHFLNDKIPNANIKLLNRVGMLAQKINERLQSVNESMTRNFINYVENLKKKVHDEITKDQKLADKYCEEQCTCHNALYYSFLYEMDAPCIHPNVDIIEKEYCDNIAQMIHECHKELNVIMRIDEFEICTIEIKIQDSMNIIYGSKLTLKRI